MPKMGRPPVEIDVKIFENLCSIFCTLDEIAGVFGCSADTIERWCKREYKTTFAEAYKKASGKGRMSLRRMQFKLAEKSAAMAIFLGKNYLGQTDNPAVIGSDEDATVDDALTAALRETAERMEAGDGDAAE